MTLSIARELYLSDDRETISTRLGAGVSREVFRSHRDGNAYKIVNPYESSEINLHEAAVSAFLRGIFHLPGVIWPNFVCHEVETNVWVSEVTCFSHNPSSVPMQRMRFFADMLMALGVSDADPGRNIFACKGFIVPIDLGYHALISENPWTEDYWTQRSKWTSKSFSLSTLRDDVYREAREQSVARAKWAAENPGWIGGPMCNCSLCVPKLHTY